MGPRASLPGFEPRTDQSVASRYAVYAVWLLPTKHLFVEFFKGSERKQGSLRLPKSLKILILKEQKMVEQILTINGVYSASMCRQK